MLNSISYVFKDGYFVAEKNDHNELWSVWLSYGQFMDEPYHAINITEDMVMASYNHHREYYCHALI